MHVEDLGTTEAFYRDVVGADFIARFDPPGLLFFDLDGTRVLFEAGGAAKGNSILYLWTDDLDACVAELEAKGVRFTHPPQADADGTFGAAGETEWMAFFEDPEGDTVALVTRKCASAAWGRPRGAHVAGAWNARTARLIASVCRLSFGRLMSTTSRTTSCGRVGGHPDDRSTWKTPNVVSDAVFDSAPLSDPGEGPRPRRSRRSSATSARKRTA